MNAACTGRATARKTANEPSAKEKPRGSAWGRVVREAVGLTRAHQVQSFGNSYMTDAGSADLDRCAEHAA
jgi:hypothetical protein